MNEFLSIFGETLTRTMSTSTQQQEQLATQQTLSPYFPPLVWRENAASAGPFPNKPHANARSVAELPRGSHPIQLYSLATPNGQKVTILLEELGVDYDAWLINIGKGDQFTTGFTKINPNQKIPAMIDATSGSDVRVFESGSILLHLATKYDRFIPRDPAKRVECMNWLFWNIGTAPFVGGGFGHFYKYAPVKIQYAIDRYTMETKRILDVLDKTLQDREFVAFEYSIADMAIFPWIRSGIDKGYGASEFVGLDQYTNIQRWLREIEKRPAVQRGLRVNSTGKDGIPNRHSTADFDTPAQPNL